MPDGKRVTSIANDGAVKIWDLLTGYEVASFIGESAIRCCAISPNGLAVIAGEESGRVHFLQIEGLNKLSG